MAKIDVLSASDNSVALLHTSLGGSICSSCASSSDTLRSLISGSIRKVNQTMKPAISPLRKPMRLPRGQYSTASTPGMNCSVAM